MDDQSSSNNGGRRGSEESQDRKPDMSGEGKGARRAYRACAHCRSRKAKCDLGDIDNPKEPPCARCKRESRECTFLPSRRGGNLSDRPKPNREPSTTNDEGVDAKKRKRTLSATGPQPSFGGDFVPPLPDMEEQSERSWEDGSFNGSHNGQNPHLLASSSSSNAYLPPPPLPPQRDGSSTQYNQSPSSIYPPLAPPPNHSQNNAAFSEPSSTPPVFAQLYHSAYPHGPISQPLPPPPTHHHQASLLVSNHPPFQPSPSSQHQPPSQPDRPDHAFPSSFLSPPAVNPSPEHQLNHPYSQTVPSHSPPKPTAPHLPPPAPPRPLQPPKLSSSKSHRSTAHDPESFVIAGMANEADALSLLALTATGPGARPGNGKSPSSEHVATPSTGRSVGSGVNGSARRNSEDGGTGMELRGEGGSIKGESEDGEEEERVVIPALESFDLIRLGILTKESLKTYVDQFFLRHHQMFPMVPSFRIPKMEAQLSAFAYEDKELLTTFVVIASRFDSDNKTIHDKSWDVMRGYISSVVVDGRDGSVGFVEACLLLSENLPRREELTPNPGSSRPWDDSAQSWNLVGHAVRTGYYLGLDQQTLYVDPKAPTTPQLDRERLAWTYCYLFDRHISLRLGKAFWSRGPGLCFTPNDAAANFPSLRPIEGEQDDFASVVQALVELTQTMTNSHDVLYPSKDRTISLVTAGAYYRYLDEFTRSINSFRDIWTPVKFSTFPTSEVVWCTYQYLRLYIYSFAFQAHVQRAAALGADTHKGSGALFPRGLTQSPDAKFIFESVDAARQLLELCTERLHPGGALPYLPNRVILWFTYGSCFLLKAIYSGAVIQADTKPIVELVHKVIFCLGASSPDRSHLGLRHALLLRNVAKKLRQSFQDDAWVSHTGTVSPIINDFPSYGAPFAPNSSSFNPSPGRPFFPPQSHHSNPQSNQNSVSSSSLLNASWPDYSHASANAHALQGSMMPPPNPFTSFVSDQLPSFAATPMDHQGWPGEFEDILGGEGGLGGGADGEFFSLDSNFWENLAVPGGGLPFR